MNKDLKLGFIGCGKMTSAIVGGMTERANVFATVRTESKAEAKRAELGISVGVDNRTLVEMCDVIFLATEPKQIEGVLEQIHDLVDGKVVVSIAAGVSLEKLEKWCGKAPVVRVMPNAPLIVREGMCAIVKGRYCKDEHVRIVEEVLENLGKCVVVDEGKMDVITAISGSGPAFFYKMIHEIALAGEKLGLKYEEALLLAVQTGVGSTKLMSQTELKPEQLIDNICTKGGCTEVGVKTMNDMNSAELFYEVIRTTAEKAKSLG
ncbi:pyrroline-5-carboxylate reductase [bacterium]|nr:pyrroline-5-carboxylate reductase [bacterium]